MKDYHAWPLVWCSHNNAKKMLRVIPVYSNPLHFDETHFITSLYFFRTDILKSMLSHLDSQLLGDNARAPKTCAAYFFVSVTIFPGISRVKNKKDMELVLSLMQACCLALDFLRQRMGN